MSDKNSTTARAVNLGNSCRECGQYHDGDGLLCNKCAAQDDKQQTSTTAGRGGSIFSIRARVLHKLAGWADMEAERTDEGNETDEWKRQCLAEADRLRRRATQLDAGA